MTEEAAFERVVEHEKNVTADVKALVPLHVLGEHSNAHTLLQLLTEAQAK